MATEDDFQRVLDANPEDWQARLVFADWLQERGDLRAEGYRALGMLRLVPLHDPAVHNGQSWWWTSLPTTVGRLPADWFQLLEDFGSPDVLIKPITPSTRRECEDAAALAFAKLPPGRRSELLSAPTAPAARKRARRTRRDRTA